MRRTQIYFDEPLFKRVRKVAAAQRRSAAALIREATARYLDQTRGHDDDPIRAFIGKGTGGPRDAAVDHDRYLYGSDR
jgi:predicted transcriptional regulator